MKSSKTKKKLAFKVTFLISVCVATIVLLSFFLPKNPNSYLHGFKQKDNLLKQTHSPKIILVGDSNMAFGIDSAALKREYGENVVNTGLHGGLGMDFPLNWTGRYISNGDTVLVSFAYPIFFGKSSHGDETVSALLLEEPRAWKYLDCGSARTLFSGLGNVCGDRILDCLHRHPHFSSNEIYNAQAFNEFGDVVSQAGKSPHQIPPTMPEKELSADAFNRLAAFVTGAEARGAKVCIIPPPYRADMFDATRDQVREAWTEMQKRFPKEAVGEPSNFVYEASFFFDTEYHLNGSGRKMRTHQIVNVLGHGIAKN